MNVTGDRTAPHGLATIGYDDEGVETQSWDIVKDGVLVGYQLDRQMAHDATAPSSTAAGPTAAPTPTPPATSRSSGWPTSRCSRARRTGHRRADRQVERGLYIVGDKSWSIDMQRYNFQFTGAALLPIEDGRLTGPGARRRPTRPRPRTSGARWTPSAARRPRCSAAPSTAARPSPGRWRRSATAARARCFRGIRILNTRREARSVSISRQRGPPAGPRRARAGHLHGRRLHRDRPRRHQRQPALGQQHPDHQRRDARVDVTVISFAKRLGATEASGSVSGTASTPEQVRPLVAAADAAARGGRRRRGRGRPGRRRRRPPTGTTARRDLDIHVFDDVAPAARRGLRARRRRAAGSSTASSTTSVTTTYLGSSTGPAAAARPADRPLRLHRQDRRPAPTAPGSAAPPATSPTSTPRAFAADLATRLGWGERRVDLPAGRYDTILPPSCGRRPDDLRLLERRRPHRPRGPDRVSSAAVGGTRIGEQIAKPGVHLLSDPAYAGLECAPFALAGGRRTASSVFDNGLPLGRTAWIADGRLDVTASRPGTPLAMTGQPTTPSSTTSSSTSTAPPAPTTSSPASTTGCC